jgi:hypothetical protein
MACMSKMPTGTSGSRVPPISNEPADPSSTAMAWPDMRRPVNVDPSGRQPILAASSAEIRLTPMPCQR